MAYYKEIETVDRLLSGRDKLMQLAEECNELAQACHKVARALPDSINPTPVDFSTAMNNLQEEAADVLMCLDLLALIPGDKISRENAKWPRWAHRLEACTVNPKNQNII